MTSVYQLTRALGVDVVAEGVEDEGIARALAELPGMIGQGWYFGRPMSVEELCDWCHILPRPIANGRRFWRLLERPRLGRAESR